MGGLMLIVFVFLFKSSPLAVRLAWGLFYAVAFIPLTYWVDRVTYRAYQRRVATARPASSSYGKWPSPGHGASTSSTRAPSLLVSECRSPGSNRVRRPALGASTGGPSPDENSTVPSRTIDPRVLAHLVIAERLAGREHDEHGARVVIRMEDDRIARPGGCLELEKIPALHRRRAVFHTADRLQRPRMSLVVDTFVMGPFSSNCYVVRSERGAAEAAVIDPGDDPTPLRLELARHGRADRRHPRHPHRRRSHRRCRRARRRHGQRGLGARGRGRGAANGRDARRPACVRAHDPAHTVSGGDEVTVAGITFEVIDVPGHSAGHVAFLPGDQLFSGDLLFAGSVGRVDLEGGDWDTLLASVRAPRSTACRPRRFVYPGPRTDDDARAGARDQPVPARIARARNREPEVPGSARDARRPARPSAVVAPRAHDRGGRSAATAIGRIQTPGFEDTRAVRAHVRRGVRRRAQGDVHVRATGATAR